MRQQKIKTRPTIGQVEIGGWLSDRRRTYLWFGFKGECIGIIDGQPLYRLAKAIVRRFEEEGK